MIWNDVPTLQLIGGRWHAHIFIAAILVLVLFRLYSISMEIKLTCLLCSQSFWCKSGEPFSKHKEESEKCNGKEHMWDLITIRNNSRRGSEFSNKGMPLFILRGISDRCANYSIAVVFPPHPSSRLWSLTLHFSTPCWHLKFSVMAARDGSNPMVFPNTSANLERHAVGMHLQHHEFQLCLH